MNILYIEDDQGLWTLVKHALKTVECNLIGAHSVSRAVEIANSEEISLAIVDHELPDGKGIEFVSDFSTKIPCIMLTGVGSEELVVACMLKGARDYIVKDVQGRYLERLPRVIQRVIREIELEQENQLKEAELSNTRKQLQLVFDAAPDLMIIADENENILQMSLSASDIYNLSISQYVGKTLEALIPEDDCKKIFAISLGNGDGCVETKLSNTYDVIANAKLLRGNVHLIVFRNQTEKIKATIALAQAEAVENENRRLQKINEELAHNLSHQSDSAIIGNSPVMRELMSYIQSVADTDATVLILGETGTGKELIADEIHAKSNRHNEVLIKLNCASIPSELIESELFGYEKGSFTGAQKSREGRFSQANNGTLFLDEIGELDLKVQSKLLRVLQEGEILPLGSQAPHSIDVRVIAATNRNLEKMVQEGTFRADLYYRLNVVPLYAPALRDRVEDIPLLAFFFFQKYSERYKNKERVLTDIDILTLSQRKWPGNVRELQNIVERFVVLGTIEPASDSSQTVAKPTEVTLTESCNLKLCEVEKAHILRVLDNCQWIISGDKGAAAALGLNPSTLRFRMQKLGITRQTHQLNPILR